MLRTPNQIKSSTPATECARNVFTDSEDLRVSQMEISGPFAVARICSRFGWNDTLEGGGLVDATHFTDLFEDRISHTNVCESLLHVAIIFFFVCDQHMSDINAVCCFNIVCALCFRTSHTFLVCGDCKLWRNEERLCESDAPCKFYRLTTLRSYLHWNVDSISRHDVFSLIYVEIYLQYDPDDRVW